MTGSTNRRGLFRLLAAAALSVPLGLAAGEAAGRRLNVLFIGVDDLRPELNCYGHKQIISPSIDRLAAGGLLFERAYCQQAVCAPSRASILSGVRPDTTRIYELNTPLRTAMPGVLTLPEHFKNNGYQTLSIGKIYHHPNDDRRAWTVAPYRATGAWKGRGYLTKEAQTAATAFDRKAAGEKRGIGPAYEAADVPDSAYPDGSNTDHAIEELTRLKNEPFFLAMGFYKPHLPFNAPKRHWDRYRREDIRLADNPFVPKDAPSYATTSWGELRAYHGIPATGPCSEELARTLIHGYYACVTYTDAQIGRLLDALERLGLADKTVVILWGDHGWKLGEHAGWCKHTNFELDTHVPMLIRVPGMASAGCRTRALTEYVDMYPTLCEVCGLTVPKHLEGLSLAPLLEKPDRPWKQAAFSQYPRGRVMGYSMCTERFRYTEWQDRTTGAALARELYDHEKDPHENVNAAGLGEYAAEVSRLSSSLEAGWRGALPK